MAGSANAGLTLSYGYLSDGTKTSSVTNQGEGLKYRGCFVYEVSGTTERLSSVAWNEGRTEYDYSVDLSNPEIKDLWYISDHLGNTRAVALMDYNGGTVVESNEFLPFGTRLANPSCEQNSNRYRFCGKEEQRFGTFDLALSDFGARLYDPFSARWTTRDPLAGKYYSLSPYNYCGGNPIRFTDRDGLDWKDKTKGYAVGVITNIFPIAAPLRDAVTVTDASDYNSALKKTDQAAMVIGGGLMGGGAAMLAAGESATTAGGMLALSGAGAPAGALAATGGVTLIGAGAATTATGTMLMANASRNQSEGYDRGNKTNDSIDHGKNEKHGDGGRAFSKSERQRKALQESIDNASSKKEKNILSKKLKHIIRDAQYKEKGEEHSRGNKR